MAKKYDDFDEADQDGIFDQIFGIISNNRRTFAIVSVTAAVLVLGMIVWDGVGKNSEEAASESVPIVRADAGDYKTRPENPGGMEVPYRDSTVFASGDQTQGGTENILADDSAEEPVSRDKAFAGLNTEGDQPGGAPAPTETPGEQQLADASTTTSGGEVEATQAANADLNKVAPVEPPSNDALVKQAIGTTPTTETSTPSGVTPSLSSEEEPAPVAEAPKAEEPKKDVPKKAEPKVTAKAETKASAIEPAAGATAGKGVKTGGSYVQLASVKSTAGAAGEYKKLQAKYSGLSGVNYRTQEANLGAKGTFYRIQAGPMSKDDATRICGSIKSSGGSCLVVAK